MTETTAERGWVVVGPKFDGEPMIFDSVMGPNRNAVIEDFVVNFEGVETGLKVLWKRAYRRGLRCVRATRTVTIETEGER